MDNSPKQPWAAPELTCFGRVEEITAQIVKRYGLNDGVSLDINGDGQGDIAIGGPSIS